MNQSSNWQETIAAIATPPGIGAISIIRVSGSEAIEIVNRLFPKKDLTLQASHTLHFGVLQQKNELLDEVVVSLYKAPHSYTGENVVEISCHGSPYVQEKILMACINEGARPAKPGEFTMRAFINGKLDLTQAEAVADMIASQSEAARRTALQQMRGGFSQQLKALREELIKFSALIELELDFSQEDVEFADSKQLFTLIDELQSVTKKLLNSFVLGNVIKNGVQVAIVGKPNAGKSTLLNALLNEDRAIVSEIEGTTRDTIEEVININGIIFRLIDTAGIRTHTTDTIESMGIEKTRTKMAVADIIIYMFDAAHTKATDLMKVIEDFGKDGLDYLLVANKTDMVSDEETNSFMCFKNVCLISAKEKKGIDVLKDKLVVKAMKGYVQNEDVVITNARHVASLQLLQQSLEEVKAGMDNNLSGDLIAPDIRQCLYHLGEITGEITNEDQLDFIFSKFCIGK